MKIKLLFTAFTLFILCSFVTAQGNNCPGNKIKVYKGASGCQCHCMKECVTPEELPTYLANGWNTDGCWNCCKLKNWVDAGIQKTMLDEVYPNVEPAGSLTVTFTVAEESNVKIQVLDMTGKYIATVADQYYEDEEHELIWDEGGLSPGVYLLTLEAGSYHDTKMISVTK